MENNAFKTEDNPWKEVAALYDESAADCLFSLSKDYICSEDKAGIDNYNKSVLMAAENNPRKDEILGNKMVTNIPAEPWGGNPFKAKLIVLSLNPGYVPEFNEKLAKLLQSNDEIRKAIINYKKQTLLFDTDSFLPEDDKVLPGCQISCKDAINMLGDWYWHKMFRQLREDVEREKGINENEFYKKVALIQYFGYSSQTAQRTLPYIPSQDFTREMIHYIASERKNDVCFLIMRSVSLWMNLLGKDFFNKYKDIIKINENVRCQYITPGNLGTKYDDIKNIICNEG
ncbi:MAG: hypothetical protein IKQ09_03545 [Bacteroidales bacterium]|nr:hypothetical protein [Bacteroidales bacterium]